MASIEEIAESTRRFRRNHPTMTIPNAIVAAMNAKGISCDSDAVFRAVQRELSRRGGVMTARRRAAEKLNRAATVQQTRTQKPQQLLIPGFAPRHPWEVGL